MMHWSVYFANVISGNMRSVLKGKFRERHEIKEKRDFLNFMHENKRKI